MRARSVEGLLDARERIGALPCRRRDDGTVVRSVDDEGTRGEIGPVVDLLGDTAFTAATMDPAAPTAGIHTDLARVRRMQAHLGGRRLLLPSHDPTVPLRIRGHFDAGKRAAR